MFLPLYIMLNSINSTTSQVSSTSVQQSPYDFFLKKFSELLAANLEEETSENTKQELSALSSSTTTNSETTSAYSASSEPWSLASRGSHIVNGIQLIPGAPGYDATAASSYHEEIALSTLKNTTTATSTTPLSDLLKSIETTAQTTATTSQQVTVNKTEVIAQETAAPTSPPSAYVATSTPWSLETHGSHIVNGIQLIPGAPGYNAALASPYHQEIAETNARYFS